MADPLHVLPVESWRELQDVFTKDLPRCTSGWNILDVHLRWIGQGIALNNEFKVHCPYGRVENGMVALNISKASYEVLIQCPKDSTAAVEQALEETKVINWSKECIVVPFAPPNVIEILKRIAPRFDRALEFTYCDRLILEPSNPMYEVSIPPNVTFKPLTLDHADLINNKWPHRYPGSVAYFQHFINGNQGYGLYIHNQLAAWVFIAETGHILHLYTLEDHRRSGYAKLLVKLFCNKLREEKRQVYCFIVKGNENSYRLFKDLGFVITGEVAWCRMFRNNSQL